MFSGRVLKCLHNQVKEIPLHLSLWCDGVKLGILYAFDAFNMTKSVEVTFHQRVVPDVFDYLCGALSRAVCRELYLVFLMLQHQGLEVLIFLNN